jgi:signal transduction histidine kinase
MARILVVDDQRISRETVAAILREADHEVATGSSGEEGLHLAREWSPDVIILDVYMPGLDGFEVVQRLQAHPVTGLIPVIFLTAEPPSDDQVVRGLDLGAYDFLTKGGSRGELLARVGVMARIKRGADELRALARISDSLLQTLDPGELARRFVGHTREVFRAEGALFCIPASELREPLTASNGVEGSERQLQELALVLGGLVEDGAAAVVRAEEVSGPGGALLRRGGVRSMITSRLPDGERGASMLAVFSTRENSFRRDSDPSLLQLVGRQALIALENALLHAEAREQAAALEASMQQRSRFFASMSHELRTPINAVIGYNELLRDGVYGDLSETQERAVGKVAASARHLLELINDVLDISKIEAGKLDMEVQRVDLTALIHDTVTSIALQAEEKGIEMIVDAPPRLEMRTDPARVRQIVLNLLSNAVKFTSEGHVRVAIHHSATRESEKEGEQVEVQVSDTGPGIALEDQKRVFEEFEQVGQQAGQGTGLGLAISARLAELLGGGLSVESEPGMGSTFTLSLPLETPAPAMEP